MEQDKLTVVIAGLNPFNQVCLSKLEKVGNDIYEKEKES
jgi:hypothetical protein